MGIALNLIMAILWSVCLYDDLQRIKNNPRNVVIWFFMAASIFFISYNVYNIGMEIFH